MLSPWLDRLLWISLVVLALAIIAGDSGCASLFHHVAGSGHSAPPAPSSGGSASVPGLDLFILLGIATVAAGVVAFFLVPEQHRISLGLAGGGGTLGGLALFLKVTLWIIRWIFGGLLILAAIVAAIELYLKFKRNLSSPDKGAS